jgi:hypothetical protein
MLNQYAHRAWFSSPIGRGTGLTRGSTRAGSSPGQADLVVVFDEDTPEKLIRTALESCGCTSTISESVNQRIRSMSWRLDR